MSLEKPNSKKPSENKTENHNEHNGLFRSILEKLEKLEKEGKIKIARPDLELQIEIIRHIAKKRNISENEAAVWFAEHWAEICRRHINKYYASKEKDKDENKK